MVSTTLFAAPRPMADKILPTRCAADATRGSICTGAAFAEETLSTWQRLRIVLRTPPSAEASKMICTLCGGSSSVLRNALAGAPFMRSASLTI